MRDEGVPETGYRVRVAIVATAAAAVALNACAFWGPETARRGAVVLQLCVTAGAVVYGLIQTSRMSGIGRWWRALATAALVSFQVGAVVWRVGEGLSPAAWVVPHFLLLVFAFASVLLLAYTGGALIPARDASVGVGVFTTTLDGLVAATAFAILVIAGGFGAMSSASLPRAGNAGVDTTYALVEMIVVVFAAVIGMIYQAGRPNQINYLIFACGVVLIAASDRVMAYFDSVHVESGQIWGGLGFILGPLFIGLSMRDIAEPHRTGRYRPLDWAQLTLPYTGFLGITILLTYHVLTGHQLPKLVVGITLVMVILVATRQVVALGAQRLLTGRLYEAQRGLAHQVFHDALTGLPNRLMFARRLDEALSDGTFVLIFVDLDDFKDVNDRFGHAAGDGLLRAVGQRLRSCVTDVDTLARVGGDEFALLIDGEQEVPEVVADRLRVALRDPFAVHGSSVRVNASMGLVRPGTDGAAQTSDDLLRQADISMYAGKRLGKDTAVVYQPSAGVVVDFPTALREAQGRPPAGFSLVFQPVVRLPEETPVAIEALARWTAPNGIHIPPQTFVAAAESAGMGATLDALVLDMACCEVLAAGIEVDIHVNIGAARLGNPGFEEDVRRTLERHRLNPARLVVEVTETVPIVDLADAAAQIARLNAVGVRVALDDFGAGYNSLTYLHTLPVHIVKLDRSLAVGAEPERDLALYRSVTDLCGALGFQVIAEGIETRARADTVLAAGCDLVQGFFYGRPAPLADVRRTWRGLGRSACGGTRHDEIAGSPG